MKIKQVYVPYWKWECFQFGMYSRVKDEDIVLKQAIEFMSDTKLFSDSMKYVVNNWNNTMLNSLSNPSINKIAFIGQCACFNSIKCPDYLTKKAWKHLDKRSQSLANYEAKKHLKLWTLTQYQNTLQSGKIDVTVKDYQMKFQLS